MRLKLRKTEHRQKNLERRAIDIRNYNWGEQVKILKEDIRGLKENVYELKKTLQKLHAVVLDRDKGK